MLTDWTPVTLAKLSVSFMALPVIAIISVLLISILMSVYLRVTHTPSDSELAKKMDSVGGNIFYIAFIGVGLMQLAFVGLIISGVWGLISWLSSMLF